MPDFVGLSRLGRVARSRITQIMNLRATPVNVEENIHSRDCAAPGAADTTQNAPSDPDIRAIIEHWPDLPDTVKAGIVAMIRAVVG